MVHICSSFSRAFLPTTSCCSSSCTFPPDLLSGTWLRGLGSRSPPLAGSFPHGPTSCMGCWGASASGSLPRPSGLTSPTCFLHSRTPKWCSTPSRSSAGLGSLCDCRATCFQQGHTPPPSKPWSGWRRTAPSRSSPGCTPHP